MGSVTKTTIYIKGEAITASFNSLSLYQEIGAHHHLEIAFRMDQFEENFIQTSVLFGEKISIKIADDTDNVDDDKALSFIGFVTQIKKSKSGLIASGDEITIIAKSPTIFADDGPHYRAFIDKKPSDIVKDVLGAYYEIKSKVSNYTHTIPYSVQHNESSFDYVCRLAAQYGQWCYYDGSDKVVFGNPTDNTPIELNYPIDLKEFNLSQLPQPANFNYVTYDVKAKQWNEVIAKKGDEVLKSGILQANTKVPLNISSGGSTSLLKDLANSQGEALAINQIRFTGVSTNPTLLLGSLIKPTGAVEDTYRIIKISHSCNEFGGYENRFTAVASTFNTYPYTNIRAYPISQNQIGIVTKTHEDPENLGRIQVLLSYHDNSSYGTWMRMLTPHSGQERGIHFLPEVDDEVLVGFEGNNAEHPYVMGCLYNGVDHPPSIPDERNTRKTIKTKSGLKVEFHDGLKKYTIETPGENKFIMDDDSRTIVIEDEHQNKITMDEDGITIESAKDLTFKAQGDVKIDAGENVGIKAQADADIDGMNVTLAANGSLKASGSASAELSASGQTTVKGAMVMIN